MTDTDASPWYGYSWVWVLILIPFSAVIFGIVMFTLADVHRDDLVVDQYYRDGMAIKVTLSMDQLATRMKVEAVFVEDASQVIFDVSNARDSAIELAFYHVASAARDHSILLVPESGQRYSSDDVRLLTMLKTPGVWYLEMRGTDEHWRLRQRVVTPVRKLVLRP